MSSLIDDCLRRTAEITLRSLLISSNLHATVRLASCSSATITGASGSLHSPGRVFEVMVFGGYGWNILNYSEGTYIDRKSMSCAPVGSPVERRLAGISRCNTALSSTASLSLVLADFPGIRDLSILLGCQLASHFRRRPSQTPVVMSSL